MSVRLVACLTLAGLLWATPLSELSAQSDSGAVDVEINALAKDLKLFLDKHKYRLFIVGPFNAPARVKGGTGPELQVKLAQALEKLNFIVDDNRFQVEIRGEYRPQTTDGYFGAKLVVHLYDAFGTPLVELIGDTKQEVEYTREIHGEESVPRLFGITYESRPAAQLDQRSIDFKEQYLNPKATIRKTEVTTSEESPYAIEVLVKAGKEYRVLQPNAETGSGFAFVPMPLKSVYAVRLINRSPHEAAVNLTIDGLSAFQFSELEPRPSHWLVPAGESILVQGWHKNNQKSTEFKVVDFPETATAKLKIKPHPGIGLIQASFSAAWQGDENKPEDEPSARGTGFGQDIQLATKVLPREIGHIRATIAVRYEREKSE